MSNSNLCGAGDLMKSIYLLMYKPEEGVLEIRAKDFHSNYMTAVDILDDDTYLGAEISYNLFTVRKNSDAAADEDRNRLEVLPCHGASLHEDACNDYNTYSFYDMS
jgi:DNA damage-binding protein 1